MKRPSPSVVALTAVVLLAALAWLPWWRGANGVRFVEIEGFYWDKESNKFDWDVVRVEDARLLARVQSWRAALRRQANVRSLERLLPRAWKRCENALRQPMERLTVVYEDGRREEEAVNVYNSPLRDCWEQRKGHPVPAIGDRIP